MLRASRKRRWEVRRTKAHLTVVEEEDASSGVTGCHERAKRYCVRPGDYVSVDYQDQLCREVRRALSGFLRVGAIVPA